ncbi:DUF3168 domain-containing protein [Alicyclobacillus shizuokensis]|uniref:DUF3168 domain-containing protein n=1 Tax=Alicyclobacillus shizuokensis TaxID=392014 RepID=UPI00082D0568|nr:DUF3168 domain-containing protein [Alicyclobacillus shizuokensis]
MIDVKPEVYQTLVSDDQLTSLLGGKHVYQITAPDATVFPRITFFEVNNLDANYANDGPTSARVSLQVDVWSKTNYSAIVQRVNEVMESLGFIRYYSTDLYEPDTSVYHKALRYQISKEV